jgi:hypothetical protein
MISPIGAGIILPVVGNPYFGVISGLFECNSVSRARGVANAELSDEADSENDLGGSYVLHRTGHSQEDDQLLGEDASGQIHREGKFGSTRCELDS